MRPALPHARPPTIQHMRRARVSADSECQAVRARARFDRRCADGGEVPPGAAACEARLAEVEDAYVRLKMEEQAMK